MTIFFHPSFWNLAVEIIRQYESLEAGKTTLRVVNGDGRDFPKAVEIQLGDGANERPVLVLLDDGIRKNSLTTKMMKDSGWSFVVFTSQWLNLAWSNAAWRVLKAWPKIKESIEEAQRAGKQCRFEVTTSCNVLRVNL